MVVEQAVRPSLRGRNRPCRKLRSRSCQPALTSHALVGSLGVLDDVLEEAAGGQELRQRPLVLVAGQPDLASLGSVQLRVVPAERPDRGRGAAPGGTDVGHGLWSVLEM